MPDLTIVASAVRALLELAVSKGASRQTLAKRSQIDPMELADSDNRITFRKYVALMRAGQELCNDPALALHFGEAVDVTELSIACSVGGFRTIDEAFAQVNRYARLGIEVECVGNGDRYHLTRRPGQLWIVDARRNPNDFLELTESSFARMVCSTRRTLGDRMFKELHVTHDAPAYRAEYERIFRMPVVFRSDKNAIRLDEGILSALQLPPSSRYVSEVLRNHAETLLDRLESSRSTRGRVETVLMPVLHCGDVSVDAIGSKLGLSRQTLFRRLKAEGVTFEQIRDELRHKLALHYLSANKASVNETARLVGYSDPAAFSRAFKRWTGHCPREHISRDTASA
jgi:AraC-like DNA-binding protein